jgi:hypothetical protein
MNDDLHRPNSFHKTLAEDVPQLLRGLVWCVRCGTVLEVNAVWRLAHGWPKCCGETMTIDSPEERANR